MNHSRLLLIVALLPILAVGCKHSEAADALPPAEGPGAPALPAPPKLEAVESESTPASRELRATGSTLALKQAELGPKGSGVLSAVLVEEGQLVKKGQPLFRLDATNSYLQVKQAEAALAQAKVALSRADLEMGRMKPLVDQGAVSPANWDNVRIGQEQARVGVQQAQAALSSARAFAADTTVVAPFSGVVSAKKKNAGETVTMMPVTTVVVLQDISKIEVRVKLSENALTRVKAKDPMVVKFASLGLEKTIAVDRINPGIDPLNRTFEVVGVIPNEDRLLKAGMLVDVAFPASVAGSVGPAASAVAAQPSTPAAAASTQTGR